MTRASRLTGLIYENLCSLTRDNFELPNDKFATNKNCHVFQIYFRQFLKLLESMEETIKLWLTV